MPGQTAAFHAKQHSWSACFRPPRSLGFANPSSQDRSTRTSATTGQEQDDGGPRGGYISNRITNISASRCGESWPTPAARRQLAAPKSGSGPRGGTGRFLAGGPRGDLRPLPTLPVLFREVPKLRGGWRGRYEPTESTTSRSPSWIRRSPASTSSRTWSCAARPMASCNPSPPSRSKAL